MKAISCLWMWSVGDRQPEAGFQIFQGLVLSEEFVKPKPGQLPFCISPSFNSSQSSDAKCGSFIGFHWDAAVSGEPKPPMCTITRRAAGPGTKMAVQEASSSDRIFQFIFLITKKGIRRSWAHSTRSHWIKADNQLVSSHTLTAHCVPQYRSDVKY